MLLTKYNHRDFEPVAFGNIVDRFFNDNFFAGERMSSFSPKVDVIESTENFEIQFFIPGVDKEAINVSLDKGKLSVKGDRNLEENKDEKQYRSLESLYGKFERSFQLPENIDEEAIDAVHENGVLRLTIPKVAPKETLKSIDIR